MVRSRSVTGVSLPTGGLPSSRRARTRHAAVGADLRRHGILPGAARRSGGSRYRSPVGSRSIHRPLPAGRPLLGRIQGNRSILDRLRRVPTRRGSAGLSTHRQVQAARFADSRRRQQVDQRSSSGQNWTHEDTPCSGVVLSVPARFKRNGLRLLPPPRPVDPAAASGRHLEATVAARSNDAERSDASCAHPARPRCRP